MERLRARNAKLESELARTRTALDIMGKAHALLEQLSESAEEKNPRAAGEVMDTAFTELRAARVSIAAACALTGRSRATHYRRHQADRPGPVHGPRPAAAAAALDDHRRTSAPRCWRC